MKYFTVTEERDIILKKQHIHNLKKFFKQLRHDIVNIKTNNYTGKVPTSANGHIV